VESFADVEWVALEPTERAELAETNAEIERLGDAAVPIWEFGVTATRRLRADGGGTFPKPVLVESAVERPLPGHEASVGLRCFVPERPVGVYLHLHGGGWVLGSAREQDLQLHELSEAAQLAVVSVEYRLAPEHRYPAACDDAEAAALWLTEHAHSEFGTDRLVIGGESAGAHLAAATLLRLRDRHGLRDAFRAVNFSYGVFDLGLSPSARRFGARNLVLSTPLMAWYIEQFLAGGDPRDPDRSPL
jgi:acetyl esterase/lipase